MVDDDPAVDAFRAVTLHALGRFVMFFLGQFAFYLLCACAGWQQAYDFVALVVYYPVYWPFFGSGGDGFVLVVVPFLAMSLYSALLTWLDMAYRKRRYGDWVAGGRVHFTIRGGLLLMFLCAICLGALRTLDHDLRARNVDYYAEVEHLIFADNGRVLVGQIGRRVMDHYEVFEGIKCWDCASGRGLLALPQAQGNERLLARGPSADTFLTYSRSEVTMWNVRTGKGDVRLRFGERQAKAVGASSNGQFVAVADDEGLVKVFSVEEGHEVWESWILSKGKIVKMVVCCDGTVLVAGDEDGGVWLEKEKRMGESRPLWEHVVLCRWWCLALAPDGSTAATDADVSRDVVLWNLETRRRRCNLVADECNRSPAGKPEKPGKMG